MAEHKISAGWINHLNANREAMILIKPIYSCLLAALPTILLLSSTAEPSTAQLVTRKYSCSQDGFTGTILVNYEGRIVYNVRYKIDKGRNKGGNKANVIYNDGGTLPIKEFETDRGIQDNTFHLLGGKYSRGGGGGNAKFIFDKSNGRDPSCTVSIKV